MNGFLESLKSLGTMRLTAIAGAGVAVLAFFIYMLARMSSPPLTMLYGNLDLGDSGAMVRVLDTQKIPYELRAGGAELWVPADQMLNLRVKMAQQNLPGGGSVAPGYEIFDKSDVLGSTSFMQDVNLLRALEGELARTIHSINGIGNVRVHLVLPRREMFSTITEEPSASITLKMEGNRRLASQQVKAIQNLVAASVPRLKPQRISIVDDRGTLLAKGNGDQTQALIESAQDMKLQTEQRLQRTIEQLIERTVGPDNVRAEVSVEMDFDKIATTTENFDPDSRVVRSEVTSDDNTQTNDAENNSVSVQQNLPDINANQTGAKSQSKASRTQSTANYEISKTTRNQVKEVGTIKRITAGVMVDGIYVAAPGGPANVLNFQARDQKEIDQIAALVRSAIGFNQSRGDQVDVINLPFAGHNTPPPVEVSTKIFGFERDFVQSVAQNLGLSIVAILFLLLVLRPLVSRAVESLASGMVVGPDGRRMLPSAAGAAGLLGGPGGPPPPAPGMLPEELEAVDELIDIDKVEGRVKASSLRKIGEIVEKHPEEALSIIRAWMFSDM